MKVLSLWQPWASLMALGLKRFETRHWMTTYRGPVAIHAARTRNRECREAATVFGPMIRQALGESDDPVLTLPFGAVLSIGQLAAIYRTEDVPRLVRTFTAEELAFGNYGPDRYAWDCPQTCRLSRPIAFRGRQGLFTPDTITRDALLAEWEART